MSALQPRDCARIVRWFTVLSIVGALLASERYAAAQSSATPDDSTKAATPAPAAKPAKPGFVSLAPA